MKFGYYTKNFVIWDKTLYNICKKLGKADSKYIPKEVKQLPSYKLEVLLDSLIKGDGETWKYKCKNKVNSKVIRYYTKSKQLADDIQEIALKTSKCAWIQRYRNLYRVNFINPNKREIKPVKTMISQNRFRGFETPNGTVLIRFNGKPCFVHNVHKTAVVVVQEVNGVFNILYSAGWSREDFETIHDRIEQIYKQYHVQVIYADAEDVGENQRLESRGLNVVPVAFNQSKVQMQTRMKILFHQNKIRIPEENVDLIRQLRKYSWNTKKDDDYVDALMLALHKEPEEGDYFYQIL